VYQRAIKASPDTADPEWLGTWPRWLARRSDRLPNSYTCRRRSPDAVCHSQRI